LVLGRCNPFFGDELIDFFNSKMGVGWREFQRFEYSKMGVN
jgi:hypothetical protein